MQISDIMPLPIVHHSTYSEHLTSDDDAKISICDNKFFNVLFEDIYIEFKYH